MNNIDVFEQVCACVFVASFALGVISFIVDIWFENRFFEKLLKTCIVLICSSLIVFITIIFGCSS